MYRGPKELNGQVFHAHQCHRCSIIFLTVERIVSEEEAELLEESLYQVPTPSSQARPFALDLLEKWKQQKTGSS